MERLHKEAKREIENAQRQIKGKKVIIQFEDVLVMRKRRMSIIFEDKE